MDLKKIAQIIGSILSQSALFMLGIFAIAWWVDDRKVLSTSLLFSFWPIGLIGIVWGVWGIYAQSPQVNKAKALALMAFGNFLILCGIILELFIKQILLAPEHPLNDSVGIMLLGMILFLQMKIQKKALTISEQQFQENIARRIQTSFPFKK